ncbi:MAG: DUF1638 domain-containing protein [Desulfobacula sp.]|uniref:DUF1638 domain-containing protein n=1 Tax=Desulfobacula sp. TaxID=2593537 RepID=UPI001DD66ADF|nr:DUF1638 domain-containing protein [Desulfobacula sp.]MBT3484365.1 DUF1638 domain-containing protein [Desulfobacula sp.]MBT3806705.1 DUF1638 domain-containing protein [Desulfobacula sp.]MBT4024174.1 DUF1638 domain-containing protein [Desulfobacula sp.]MBT4197403.1 DUF1638 domain-containing protein [Desulfobacula sp.]
MTLHLMPDTGIISCKVFKPELTALGIAESRIIYLEQDLHQDPGKLHENVSAAVACLEQNSSIHSVILLYGYCGGGLADLISSRLRLIIPLAHDCIPLILGGCPDEGCDPAFFLSPGWIDHGLTPLTEYFEALEKYGQKDALWLGMEILKNYKEVVLVETLAGIQPRHLEYTQQMAALFQLSVRQVTADKTWLVNLLSENFCEQVLTVYPGDAICLGMYPSTKQSGIVTQPTGQGSRDGVSSEINGRKNKNTWK